MERLNMRNMLLVAVCALLFAGALALVGCSGGNESDSSTLADSSEEATESVAEAAIEADPVKTDDGSLNYMVLVNKLHMLPDGWEEAIETTTFKNTVGDDVEVEKKAYDAYLKLKADLESEGVFVDLDSARRSVADQQRIMDEFTKEYGENYATKTVAEPGYSEHHTGLALDLYLIIDGKDVVENEEMMQYPEIWEKIHAKLAENGFILRYLKDREHITGYGYEPWHIRYIDDPEVAKQIMSEDITFEEYRGDYRAPAVEVDLGTSELYSQEELEEAAIQIKCEFAYWVGCELHNLRYVGDECNTKENIDWLNELNEEGNYKQVAEFVTDFHSPAEQSGAWEADCEYVDYQWWLGRTEDGGWDIVSIGY